MNISQPDSGDHTPAPIRSRIPTLSDDDDAESPEGERNLLLPVTIALLLFAIAAAVVIHFTYHKTFADGTVSSTIVYPIHSDAPSGGIRLLGAKGEDNLYVLPVVAVHNNIVLPIFIESIAVDLTLADGSTLHCTDAQGNDFQSVFAQFPSLGRTVDLTGDSPLLRDTRIESDATAHGLVMAHFLASLDDWQHRQSATVTVSFYHQQPLVITIPANQ